MNLFFTNSLCLLIVLLAATFAPPQNAFAHRFHTSLTRVEYNQKEKIVEITVQTFSHDLEDALEKAVGKRVNLDKTPDIGDIIVKYLAGNFVLKNGKGETKQLRWIGKEQQTDAVWLYLEADMPEGITGATLENRFLFERFSDQVNLVSCHYDDKRTDLVFRPNDKPQNLTK